MFSLLDDPWILVVDTDGSQKLVGIRDIFSGEVRAIAVQGDSPAQNYAVARLLLAIFWRAHAAEAKPKPGKTFAYADWVQRTRKRLQKLGKDQVVLTYLRQFEDRFELLDSPTPFMQVADLHVKSGEVKHVTMISPEAQEDYFSMRAGKARDSLTFAEAARWLVYVQAFDYSGIKSGAVGDTRAKGGKGYPIGTGWTGMTGGTLVVGENLLDTLVLNTTEKALTSANDKPVWERTPDGPDARSAVGEQPVPQGPADLATWQSRRIRLHASDDKVVGVVIGNGDRIPNAGANEMGDPMTPYRYSPNQSKKDKDVYYPRPYDVERTMWKALDALVVAEGDGGFSAKEKAPIRPATLDTLATLSQKIEGIPDVLHLELVSVEYGAQASSVATTFAAQLSMPVVLLMEQSAQLRTQVRRMAQSTKDAAVALGQFGGNLHIAGGGEYQFDTTSTDRVLAELEAHFNIWLANLASVSEKEAQHGSSRIEAMLAQWETTARDTIEAHARINLRGAGPRAFAGRVIYRDENDTKGRFVSAASYFQLLQHKLDSTLPSTARITKSKATHDEKEDSR